MSDNGTNIAIEAVSELGGCVKSLIGFAVIVGGLFYGVPALFHYIGAANDKGNPMYEAKKWEFFEPSIMDLNKSLSQTNGYRIVCKSSKCEFSYSLVTVNNKFVEVKAQTSAADIVKSKKIHYDNSFDAPNNEFAYLSVSSTMTGGVDYNMTPAKKDGFNKKLANDFLLGVRDQASRILAESIKAIK